MLRDWGDLDSAVSDQEALGMVKREPLVNLDRPASPVDGLMEQLEDRDGLARAF